MEFSIKGSAKIIGQTEQLKVFKYVIITIFDPIIICHQLFSILGVTNTFKGSNTYSRYNMRANIIIINKILQKLKIDKEKCHICICS